LKRAKGWDFKTTAKEVDAVLGHVHESDKPKPKFDEKQRVAMLNRLWQSGVPLQAGDPVCQYLSSRDVLPDSAPTCLRYVERCPNPDGGQGPAMLARVCDSDGNPLNIHRTFLEIAPGEKRKRAMMPGELPGGCAVRLSPVHGSRLGVAEGVETALAASRRFGIPVWAALNSTLLGKWVPPQGVEEVVVFGDCDPAYGGQSAAFALAHRLATRLRLNVEVRIPNTVGLDWADKDAA
jgi:putative DNA primase/helicase